jgi:hypothetical protein
MRTSIDFDACAYTEDVAHRLHNLGRFSYTFNIGSIDQIHWCPMLYELQLSLIDPYRISQFVDKVVLTAGDYTRHT